MTSAPVKRKLAAILSADVVGYSRLMAENEAETLETLSAYKGLMTGLIRQHGGRTVNAVGDNLLADFPTAVDAVSCAVAIQQEIEARNTGVPDERKFRFRIGIHLGDVVLEGDDVYGDGVNIAARLESLADPGGVCISGTAHEVVRNKLSQECEDIGEQTLKNIPHPVRVYRVQLTDPQGQAETAALTVPGFAGRPAIAVLAFDNLGGDPEQEYFADGIAEDLITCLSVFRWFPVIARNSSFTYKGRSVDVKQVSRELGVRYVVEGSVRKAGDQIRVSAQLIDAETGHHVWAQSYDRKLADIFALQDEISSAIAASTLDELDHVESVRALRLEPGNLDAWDLVQRARWHFARFNAEDNARARALAERAIRLAPQSSPALSLVGATHYFDFFNGWSDSPQESVQLLDRTARAAVELDSGDAVGHMLLAVTFSLRGDGDAMLAAAERAVELNPSMPTAQYQLGFALAGQGRVDESVAALKTGLRLSPRDPHRWAAYDTIALAYYLGGRCDEALGAGRRAVQLRPTYAFGHLGLAVYYSALGRTDDGQTALAEALRLQPDLSLDFIRQNLSFARPEFVDRYIADLRRVGWK